MSARVQEGKASIAFVCLSLFSLIAQRYPFAEKGWSIKHDSLCDSADWWPETLLAGMPISQRSLKTDVRA